MNVNLYKSERSTSHKLQLRTFEYSMDTVQCIAIHSCKSSFCNGRKDTFYVVRPQINDCSAV